MTRLLSSYDYHLPSELIATKPIMPKEEARLLVFKRATQEISHHKFKDIAKLIPNNTTIIFNDTKVIKARFFGKKDSGASVEIMLNQPVGGGLWSAFVRGKVKKESLINLKDGLKAKVLELKDDGSRILSFSQKGKALNEAELISLSEKIGHIPLPPYIKRKDIKDDESWYQSIFARSIGAVAAPTASLHFSQEMLKNIASKFQTAYITLHIGAGTFKGVESEDILEHKMHSERFFIPQNTADIINSDAPILGVGTTTTRVVEDFYRNKKTSGECELFLNPLNPPLRQNYLLTNFHLPKSSLIMLVAGFIGLENTQKIYATAIKERYRFYSYGDGMMII